MAFCSGLNSSVRKVLHVITPTIEEYADKALAITGHVKDALQDSLTVIPDLPGEWDNDIKEKVINAANKVNEELQIFEQSISSTGDIIDGLQSYVGHLPEKLQNSTLIKFASRLLAWLDDDSEKESTYDTIVQSASLK